LAPKSVKLVYPVAFQVNGPAMSGRQLNPMDRYGGRGRS